MSTYVADRRVANSSPLFLDLRKSQDDRKRWTSIAASYAVQIVALIALLIYSIIAPRIESVTVRHIDLVAPDLETAPREVAQAKPMRPPVRPVPQPIIESVPPKIQPPPIVEPRQPERVHHVAPVEEIKQPRLTVAPKLDPKLLNVPKVPAKIIATNTFSTTAPEAAPFKPPTRTIATDNFGSSAAPTLAKTAPSKVQTGGFGDPKGVPVNAHDSAKTIAAVGSFDLPPGGGHGNGTGGTSGARGTIANAGFGNGVAADRPVNSGQAHTGGFGSGVAVQGHSGNSGHVETTAFKAPEAAPEAHLRNVSEPDSVPVSIQSKPSPMYTAEARQARVEGEVLLNVVFMANGQIRILNVVRGLGHGLDEAAQRAAQGVKFIPAKHNGHSVDSTSTLRIVFQLS